MLCVVDVVGDDQDEAEEFERLARDKSFKEKAQLRKSNTSICCTQDLDVLLAPLEG